MKVYQRLAPYYDRFMAHIDYEGEAEGIYRFLFQIHKQNGSVLDVGVGSGGHMIPLAEMGVAVAEEASESGASSRYPFYVELESDEGLLMGQHVYIEPATGNEESGIVLDAGFFRDVEGEAWVWAEGNGGKLEKRPVTLGAYDEMRDAYPVLSGLSAEDAIAFPEETLHAGMRCVPYEEAAADDGMILPAEDFIGGFEEGPAAYEGADGGDGAGIIFDEAEIGVEEEGEGA